MKRFIRISALALLGSAGGLAHAEEYETSPYEASVEALVGDQALSPPLYSGRFLQPLQVRECWYFISSEIRGRGAPAALTIRRLPTRGCEGASRILAWSYDYSGALLATRKGDELVVGFGAMMWPHPLQGAIQLFHISTDTLENLRTHNNELLATGGITATGMHFEGQKLIVQGSRVGTLPGESGEGSYYTATFERFLSSGEAPSIVAHPEAPPAEPSPTVTQGAYIPLEGLYHLPFQVKDCWYFATASSVIRGWGLAQLNLSRLAMRGCEGKTVGLGFSYDPGTFLVTTRGGSAITLAWSVKSAPEFIPTPTSLRLYNVSPDTLVNLRTAYNELSSSTGEKVHATQLDFDGHRLVVQGTKDGVLLGGLPESGAGPHFTATFERFLDGEAPASTTAY